MNPLRKDRPETGTHRVHDPGLGRHIAFRPASLQDTGIVHDWMNRPHVVPFWDLALPLPDVRRYLGERIEDAHETPYIGLLDGVPMSYWEAYWAVDDVVGRYYEAEPDDQGVHLLIGPPEFLGRGLALPLLRAMTAFRFGHAATEKVVAEPDVRNARMIHVFERCGYRIQREIDLPDKRAALMFCHRELFEREVV